MHNESLDERCGLVIRRWIGKTSKHSQCWYIGKYSLVVLRICRIDGAILHFLSCVFKSRHALAYEKRIKAECLWLVWVMPSRVQVTDSLVVTAVLGASNSPNTVILCFAEICLVMAPGLITLRSFSSFNSATTYPACVKSHRLQCPKLCCQYLAQYLSSEFFCLVLLSSENTVVLISQVNFVPC